MEELFENDQSDIRLFHLGKISTDELRARQAKSAESFKEFVFESGFPFKNISAYETYKKAVTLALHMDPNSMELLLQDFVKRSEAEIDLSDMAFLTDKVRVCSGKPQVYGTQFKRLQDGKIEFLPIEDREHADDRRKAVGLCTLQEYEEFACS